MIVITPAHIHENQAIYGTDISFRMLVRICGGWNEVFDAILDDQFPNEYREQINEVVNRDEITARAQYRLARALERLQGCP